MINSNKGCFWISGDGGGADYVIRLTVTKVVFEWAIPPMDSLGGAD